MGMLDLLLKVAYCLLYGVVLLCLGIMKVLPWRKECLADRLKDGKLILKLCAYSRFSLAFYSIFCLIFINASIVVPDNDDKMFLRAGFVILEAA